MTRALSVVLVLGLACEEPRASSDSEATREETAREVGASTTTEGAWREVAARVPSGAPVETLGALEGEASVPEGALARREDGSWLTAGAEGIAIGDASAASATVVRARFVALPRDPSVSRNRSGSRTTSAPPVEVDRRSLLLTIEERLDGGRVMSLVLRDGETLDELASFLVASNADGRGHADVRLEGGELVVAVPEDCGEASCTPTRLERWALEDPLRRRVIAQAFDEVSLDERGRFALVRTEAHRSVRVIDTRDGRTLWTVSEYAPRGESCGDDPGTMPWPEAMAIAPDGARVALVERGEGLRLRIVRAAGERSETELERAVASLPALAFVDAETLVVQGETAQVLRR